MSRKVNSKAQRPSSRGGRYILIPAAVGQSEAWKRMSFRARAVVTAIYLRHDGFNNGRLPMSVDEIGEAVGSKNPHANGLAIREAIAFGFIRTAKEYSKPSRMAREFRLTFVEAGRESARTPATDDYLNFAESDEWRAWQTRPSGNGNKMTGYDSEVETPLRAYVSEGRRKQRAYDPEVETVETPLVSVSARASESEGPVIYHGVDPIGSRRGSGEDCWMQPDELRSYLRAYLTSAPPGSQSQLAVEVGIGGGTLSKFIWGRGLPDDKRGPLQLAIARKHKIGAGEWLARNDTTEAPERRTRKKSAAA